jgi:hypothetical protein
MLDSEKRGWSASRRGRMKGRRCWTMKKEAEQLAEEAG